MNNKLKGNYGELLACLWLILHGYKIWNFNYKSKFGQIDIIASKGKKLSAIEVKLRNKQDIALEEIVSYKQRQRITTSFTNYISYNNDKITQKQISDFSMDIILIKNYLNVQHIKNAW